MEEEMEMSLMGVKPITHYRGLILKENERASRRRRPGRQPKGRELKKRVE